MPDRKLKTSTIRSLGAKLDDLKEELTPDEAAVLAGLIGLAGSALTDSHGDGPPGTVDAATVTRPATASELPSISGLLDEAFQSGARRVPAIDPSSPLADSIGVGWLCVSWSKDYNRMVEAERPGGLGRLGEGELPLRISGLRRADG